MQKLQFQVLSEDLKSNCLTIHKLLEYAPVFYEEFDEKTGKIKNTMRFEPGRNSHNPLPSGVQVIVLEEASMIAVELYNQVHSANVSESQYIFLGDIQQLPPVFGSAILGYKLLELPTVELTEVYRQALESPIIKIAHRILSGKPIPLIEFPAWTYPGQLKLHPWKKKISADSATRTLAKFFVGYTDSKGIFHKGALQKGTYNPETDAILIPFNKACGTIELNNHIANRIAKINSKPVYEMIHGFKKSYYSIGDKTLYDREDAIITNIYANPEYSGASPQSESVSLNYWGHKERKIGEIQPTHTGDEHDIDVLLRQVSENTGDDDTVRAASHIIELLLIDSETTIRIKDAGQLNSLILGYAITVHKAQGSEWDKVFVCFHQSHATMIQRELLYTAITRAKKELFIICEADTFEKGIMNQRIKGDTLAEKAIYFQGKLDKGELQS